eukprot:scaffold89677_cov23-Cyclotella_meneghiniana.AAC.1
MLEAMGTASTIDYSLFLEQPRKQPKHMTLPQLVGTGIHTAISKIKWDSPLLAVALPIISHRITTSTPLLSSCRPSCALANGLSGNWHFSTFH